MWILNSLFIWISPPPKMVQEHEDQKSYTPKKMCIGTHTHTHIHTSVEDIDQKFLRADVPTSLSHPAGKSIMSRACAAANPTPA